MKFCLQKVCYLCFEAKKLAIYKLTVNIAANIMFINSGTTLTKSMGRNEYESSQRRLCIVLKKMTIWTPGLEN